MSTYHPRSTQVGSERELERSVLDYLRRHPQAADTLRGIVNWWLPQQRYESALQRIEHVLSRLVVEGRLHCNRLPDGEVLYELEKHVNPLLH